MKKLSMIYMASGFGSRFGSNKLMALLGGRPLFLYGLAHLLEAACILKERAAADTELIIVSQYPRLLEMAERYAEQYPEGSSVKVCRNDRSQEGITASIRIGTQAASAESDACLYFVADQPCLRAGTLAALAEGFFASEKGIGCVSCEGKPGNPVIFSRSYKEELLALTGDRGGSRIIKAHPEDLWIMEAPPGELTDIDCPEDLADIDCPEDFADIDCPEDSADTDCPEDFTDID